MYNGNNKGRPVPALRRGGGRGDKSMTILEARRICEAYYAMTNPGEEDRFRVTEALDFLIHETRDPAYMVALGGIHYEQRAFDLALKYYEMAAEYDSVPALVGLGYIWYYGRTGERDYEKAFRCYDRARQLGNLQAAYKVADMYKNGYYVPRDMGKYREIIESLYPRVEYVDSLYDPLPEVYTRLAAIRAEEGRTAEALALYDKARDFLARRIQDHPFFGDLNIMKWMIGDIYRLRPFDEADFGLYDLYFLLERPVKVGFRFEGEAHTVASVPEDGAMAVCLDGDTWFRTVDDFFRKAELGGEHITTLYEELLNFEVLRA